MGAMAHPINLFIYQFDKHYDFDLDKKEGNNKQNQWFGWRNMKIVKKKNKRRQVEHLIGISLACTNARALEHLHAN